MEKPSPNLDDLTARLIAFRDARDWRQFHALKDLILSLNLEASELLELTQWKKEEEVERALDEAEFKNRLREECADVLLYLLLVSERAGIDLAQAAADKITLNEAKYPVERARGNARKYNEL